jgi:hypothetical protein
METKAQLKTRIENISPKKAQEYLDTMGKNRNIRSSKVDQYAEAMAAGLWKLTGDAIRFNTKGELIDGQHRLHAIIQSKKTIETLVIRDVPDEAFMDLDTGAPRSPGDLLTLSGYTYSHRISSAIRMASSILEIESGLTSATSFGRRKIPPAVLLEWATAHSEELYQSAKLMSTKDALAICSPPSLFTALHFLFSQYNPKGADQFFNTLIKGIGFEHGERDPVYQLRRQMLSFQGDRHRKRPTFYKAALIIKAWNAFQCRDFIAQLKYNENEKWPEINRRRARMSETQAESIRQRKKDRTKKPQMKEDPADSPTVENRRASDRGWSSRVRRAAATKSKPGSQNKQRK